jgi:hypothetical protein
MALDMFGVPRFELPVPRVLYARHGSFESLLAVTLPTASDLVLTTVSGTGGPLEICAGGIANPQAVNTPVSASLVARAGGTLVGEARITTDLNDSAAALQSIPANTPWVMRLLLWFTQGRNALSSVGVGEGGLSAVQAQVAGAAQGPWIISTQTQNVGLGTLRIGVTSVATAAVLFTLDWLRIVEYPDALP